jgi:hypothetical protein
LKGLLFVRSGYFVNTARIDPSFLSATNRRLTIKDTTTNAVGIMIGITTECNLVEPGNGGPAAAPYPVHKVSIAPFKQEMRRDTSCWGRVFGFRRITGPITENGISFSTRKEVLGGRIEANVASGTFHQSRIQALSHFILASNSPVTPKRRGKLVLSSVKSPLISGGSKSGDGYPISHAYDDKGSIIPCYFLPHTNRSFKVPIYDGRMNNGFGFAETDFKALRSLPLYSKGMSDLPNDSLVAVGYTLNTYLGQTGTNFLSTNVQFVVLLGLPE